MLPARTAAVILAFGALVAAGCTTDATEVVVRVDTDAPSSRAMVITATVHSAMISGGAGAIHTWVRAVDAGAHHDSGPTITLPATFAIVPGPDQPRDSDVVLVVDALLAPARVGDPPIQFRRIARFPFVPQHRTTLNIFLAIGCAAQGSDCTTVPPSRCTVAVRCEEMGRTCGDQATCVNPVTQPGEGDAATDAGLMDATPDLTCPTMCPGGANARGACVAGICTLRCDPNFADCDGTQSNGCETNLLASTSNCGTCGHACPAGQFCASGSCIANCSSMQTACGGACVDLHTDTQNCGMCGNVCPTPPHSISTCINGVCGIHCDPLFGDCNHMPVDGCEVNLGTSLANCGICGNVCTSGGSSMPMCVGGSCGVTCAPGRADCNHLSADGCEIDVTTSINNCGACAHACPAVANADPTCSSGTCGFSCHAGFADCDGNAANGCETDLMTNVNRCGSCSIACPAEANADPVCNSGSCGINCHPGFGNCDGNMANGCETDTQTALPNCGGCGQGCVPVHATAVCSAGSCGYSACAGGYFDLDGDRMNGCECQIDAYPNACGSAANVGTIAVGANTSVGGNIVPTGSSDWFQATFAAGGHPHITLTTNPGGHLLQIQNGCGTAFMCMDGLGDAVTDWEFFDTAGVHTTRNEAFPVTIFFRVYNTGATTCTNYGVTVSN